MKPLLCVPVTDNQVRGDVMPPIILLIRNLLYRIEFDEINI